MELFLYLVYAGTVIKLCNYEQSTHLKTEIKCIGGVLCIFISGFCTCLHLLQLLMKATTYHQLQRYY